MLKALANQVRKAGFACILGAIFVWMPAFVQASTIALADLPPQGRKTHALILEGGPFPYDKDGTIFGNRERLLPAHPRGYYREYTVKTSGSRDRGARRIVCGGKPQVPNTCYYTSDHYSNFLQIVPTR